MTTGFCHNLMSTPNFGYICYNGIAVVEWALEIEIEMGIARQLYQLQEADLEIESNEQELKRKVGQLGTSEAVINAQARLTSEQQRLDELKHQQRSAEWEIDDLGSKITAAEKQLYGGRIGNPKELSSLQHEVEAMKAKRDQLENKALEIIDQVELAGNDVAALSSQFKQLEDEWHSQQQQLSAEIDQLKTKLSDLKRNRELLLGGLDPQTVDFYEKLRKQKGQALVKVEQGICRGCRISLSVNEIQQARSGKIVQCSSCGRMLYLP